MVDISRRPRLTLCTIVTAGLLAASCSLVQPASPPEEQPARAKALAVAGNHADAARAYADLAGADAGNRDAYELLSAEQWVAAGDLAAAKQALASVSPETRSREPASRALVAAEIALADHDGVHALQELDSISVPTSTDLAQNYWYMRGAAFFMSGHPVEGTRAFVERERYLDPSGQKVSRAELFAKLRSAAERGQPLQVPPNADPIVAGWLQLAPVAVELQRDPMRAATALAAWRRAHPDHPANDGVLGIAKNQIAVATEFPDQIALLLPLSGRAEAVGVAVRDGFIADYFEQDAGSRPRLKIYDVAADGVAAAYQRAIQDGASFIVGPLTKEDVAAVVPLNAGHYPELALNFLADGSASPPNFFQFALLPEDEARAVAQRLAADGKLRGVALLPDGEWGTRVGAAFADELKQLGGNLVDAGRYDPGRADFADVIKETLQIHGAKGEPATHRSDVDFVFVAGTPGPLRLIVSQLKFHYAGDLPVYSTSDGFEPDPGANGDLDGVQFPDMPWMVSNDPVTSRLRDSVREAWPTRAARRDRLYAFGFDAYRLVPALRSKTLTESADIAGVTGKLRLDAHNRIRRELVWATIKGGVGTAQ